MTAAGLALRRVTVVTARARVDVALPASALLAELIPQLVQMAGGDSGAEHLGQVWSLARIGEPALAPGLTVAQAGIGDGEVVYLRAVDQTTGPQLFDDVVDAIAQSASSRTGMWRPQIARRVSLGVAIAAGVGGSLIAQVGTSRGLSIAIPAGLAALLLIVALLLARAVSDRIGAGAAVLAGLVPAAVCGMRSVTTHPWPITGSGLCLALAAFLVYAIVSYVIVGSGYAIFTALILSGLVGAIACSVGRLLPARAESVAALVLALVTLFSTVAPIVAARLARLPMPRVPADAAQFRVEQDEIDGVDVPSVAADTQRFLAGLLAGLGTVAVVCGAVLVFGPATSWTRIAVLAAALAWILRSRGYRSAAQRIIVLLCGLIPLTLLAARLPAELHGLGWVLGGVAGCVIVLAWSLGYSVRQSRGLSSPYWARAFDVAEYLTLIAVVPLCGAVVGVFGSLRHLG